MVLKVEKSFFDPFTQRAYASGQDYTPLNPDDARCLLGHGMISGELPTGANSVEVQPPATNTDKSPPDTLENPQEKTLQDIEGAGSVQEAPENPTQEDPEAAEGAALKPETAAKEQKKRETQ